MLRLPTAIHGLLQQVVQPEQLPEITREILGQILGAELCCRQLLTHKKGFELDSLDIRMISIETPRTSLRLHHGFESTVEMLLERSVPD